MCTHLFEGIKCFFYNIITVTFTHVFLFFQPFFQYRVGKDFRDDLEFLLQGISEFDLQNGVIASDVLIHGALAFPIGTTESGQVFLAGAYYGQGRVIVITHEGLLRREVESK